MKNEQSKVCAILSYLLIGIIWYYADDKMRKDRFAGFHAKQALVLLIACIAWNILFAILTMITFGLFALIGWIVSLLLLVWWIMGLIYAITGQEKELFWIGQYAKKF